MESTKCEVKRPDKLLRVWVGLVFSLAIVFGLAACNSGPAMLVVDVADGIIIKPELIQQFEKDNNAKVILHPALNADAMLTKPITADVAYGIDTYTAGRAIASGQFEGYATPALISISTALKSDAQNQLIPIDVNYVTVNYDKNWFAVRGIAPPADLKALTDKTYFHRLVLTNPDNTPIGLGFLLMTIAAFPDGCRSEIVRRN